ncbi:hypothetical protein [Cryptosporangium sp. NPDC051539]|uniref:hypothetical protein n=1 Tax=Cryptosporangium sp. NPDC051539 TaxID=3363962 RepID=UPI0037A7C93F
MPLVATTPRRSRAARRVAAGALLTAVFVGGSAGTALAAGPDVRMESLAWTRPAGVVPTSTSDVAPSAGTMVVTWPATSSTKSTAAPLIDPEQGIVRREGTATRLAVVWATAATVAMAGILLGSLYRRRALRQALSYPAPVRLDAWRRRP